jgi:serine/threonine protein phosphatase PrpC
MGLMSAERARTHPDRCKLTRMLGRELIVAVDKISEPLFLGDVIIGCTDGLYNAIDEDDLQDLVTDCSAEAACLRIVAAANARGTADNATVAVLRMTGAPQKKRDGMGSRLRQLWRR